MNLLEMTQLAATLDQATQDVREIERLTLSYPNLTLKDAYQIQNLGISQRLSRGEKKIGFKMGLTSEAKRQQVNLDSPIYGVLTDQMKVTENKVFSMSRLIHPKIEPEIAFLTQDEIHAPLTFEEASKVCFGVCAAMEILDSRYMNFKYFSLPDVVADNCSSAYFVLSQRIVPTSQIDLSNLQMTLSVNGRVVQQALSKSISGHPLHSLVQLSEMLCSQKISIPAGSIILAGAATQAISLEPGIEVALEVDQLGKVSLKIGA